jgi:hypothetical protein
MHGYVTSISIMLIEMTRKPIRAWSSVPIQPKNNSFNFSNIWKGYNVQPIHSSNQRRNIRVWEVIRCARVRCGKDVHEVLKSVTFNVLKIDDDLIPMLESSDEYLGFSNFSHSMKVGSVPVPLVKSGTFSSLPLEQH